MILVGGGAEVDIHQLTAARNIFRPAGEAVPSPDQDIDAAGDAQRLADVLLDHQDADAPFRERRDPIERLGRQLRRQAGRWLVEQDETGFHDQRPRDGQHHPLAAAQIAGHHGHALAEPGKFADQFADAVFEQAAVGERMTADPQILAHRQLRKDAPALGHQRKPAAKDGMRR
ncbi:MAG TPA: hypothetical protein VFU81_21060, partial [Thermomicrobiales bacterium]|nr:hypothetical protein [Thermomicrobiales bacterium]